jgi:hypothetical protein
MATQPGAAERGKTMMLVKRDGLKPPRSREAKNEKHPACQSKLPPKPKNPQHHNTFNPTTTKCIKKDNCQKR